MPYHTLMDSLDKVAKYLHAVAAEDFTFKGIDYPLQPLRVSPSVFRDYKCPSHCGACCRPFTMDWIPSEPRPPDIPSRVETFNGKEVEFFSDLQADRQGQLACRYLRVEDGRCNIHDVHTLSCDFPMITVKHVRGHWEIGGQLFGRLSQMRKPAGGKGGMCTIHAPTQEAVADVIRKFERLEAWCTYLELPNVIPDILRWAKDPVARLTPASYKTGGMIFDD
jgi:Fe-S-cluster containining protein